MPEAPSVDSGSSSTAPAGASSLQANGRSTENGDGPTVISLHPPGREPPPPPPAWAIHRRMYDWVLSLAHTRNGTLALFLLSFVESSFFPVPPDVLQIALTLEKRSKAFYYAFINTLGSVLGGVAGYAIGVGLWEMIKQPFYRFIAPEEKFKKVEVLFQQYDFWAIFAAAFTPIPYKVFTISAGVFEISLLMFIIASAVGRGARFFIVAGLLYMFGPPIKTFIERYFNLLTVVFTLLVVGAFLLLKVLH